MKHLRILEEAGLIVSRKRGREKLHFLNPVPIRLVHDRWVSKYAEPWAAGLTELKRTLEETVEKVFEIYIKTTPERLWEAITNPEMRAKYNFGVAIESDWTPGSSYRSDHRTASVPIAEGENLEVDSAAAARAELPSPLGRGRESRKAHRGSPGRSCR